MTEKYFQIQKTHSYEIFERLQMKVTHMRVLKYGFNNINLYCKI